MLRWFGLGDKSQTRKEGQSIKKKTQIQESQDLLDTFNDLDGNLNELWMLLGITERHLQRTIGGGKAQQTLENGTEEVHDTSILYSRTCESVSQDTEMKKKATYDDSCSSFKEDSSNGRAITEDSDNGGIDGHLAKLKSAKKSVQENMSKMGNKIKIMCNLEGHASASNILQKQMNNLSQQQNKTTANQEGNTGLPQDVDMAMPPDQATSGKCVHLQLYIPENVNLQNNIVRELRQSIQADLIKQHRMELQIQTFRKPGHIKAEMPLIVLCLYASRLGTNVLEALSEVTLNNNVVLLICHHVAAHDTQFVSSSRKLNLPECKKIRCVLDMVFHNKNGIYMCEINNETLSMIVEVLSEHKSK